MEKQTKKIISKELLRQLRGNSPEERILHRLHSVILVRSGLSCSEVARHYGDSARIVSYCQRRNESGGNMAV